MNDPVESTRMTEGVAPPSFAQQRLWLLDRLMPTRTAYNIEHALRLSGELDGEALRGALNELVRRHEVLRTRFGEQDGQPVQVIAPELTVALAIEDLQECAPAAREAEAQRRARAEAEAPFDLARGPLIRARLFRLAPSEHWLLIVLHHIVTDGWSSGVLTRELTALYGALHRREASPLPPLPVQYADYALWQREWLQGPVLEQQVAYWRQALAGLPTLDLPSDRPRPVVASFRGGQIQFTVPGPLTRSLKDLSRSEGATLFMSLLAAFQVLLHRYSGQDDIAVGVPTAGRTRPQLEGLIGFFVNTLVLRGDLAGNPGFTQFLQRTRDRALDAYSHQDLPFEKLVEELAPKRDLSRNPLFQASLAFQNTPRGHWQLPGLDVRRIEGIHTGAAKFDLAMSLTEREGELAGSVEYASDLFDAGTIERLAGHFVTLLEGIVAAPQCPIDKLPLLGTEERHRLLEAWNDTAADYPRDRCIHELFAQQAARSPDAVAVVCDDQRMTYGELDARANRLARHLETLGVGPDVLVGICIGRSPEMVVGLLGILKAGGAYVPLDPGYPQERLAFMLEDTQTPLLLTQEPLLGRLPPRGIRTLCLDRDWPTVATQPATCPPGRARATDLAYVIYTSGSTGTPKGVCITHRGLANYLTWAANAYSVSAGTGAPVHSSMAFDLTVTSLFAPLLTGRTVEVLAEGPGVEALAAALRARQGYSLVKLTPAHLELLAAQIPAASASGRTRAFVIGGEQLRAETLSFWRKHAPDTLLVNEYGPTETVVGCCTYVVNDGTPASGAVPIGQPIANTRLYVLDAAMEPVPLGVAGELYIAGDGVARGYWRRPELTAERFVADPFDVGATDRLYRTGDLVRRRSDGDLEFLGRRDDQVKVRGYRIELGEIQAVLLRCEHLRDAAVVLREDMPGDKRLVAYVVARDAPIAAADLRAWLARQLPDYMLPAALVAMPTLPLTANGKVDQKRLPVPEYDSPRTQFEAPCTPLEIAIAGILAEVLHRPRVGRDEDFFDLGGHSLLAARAIGMINDALAVDLTLRQLFETPTVCGLALSALERMVADADGHEVPEGEAGP